MQQLEMVRRQGRGWEGGQEEGEQDVIGLYFCVRFGRRVAPKSTFNLLDSTRQTPSKVNTVQGVMLMCHCPSETHSCVNMSL